VASLINYPNGRRAIQFVAKDGKRPIIRVGKVAKKTGELMRMHVDHLVSSSVSRQPIPCETAEWLADIGDDLHAKLAKVGLVAAREVKSPTGIGAYFDTYIKRRSDLGATTINNIKQVRRYHVMHFGADRNINTITKGELGDWHRFVKSKLSQPTVAMHVKKTKQVLADAVDRRLLDHNPAAHLKAGTMENRERFFYVTAEMIDRVIAACPDAEWRLIFALARHAGLRVPSETTALRWEDVHWDTGRMIVRSPKTVKHGKASREVPIFPALSPYLRDAFEQAEEGARHVIVSHRGENLRTMAHKIIRRAGIDPWERLFQNLRSSCETDLTSRFPLHVACAWIGNTEAVARKHYLQVTDQHFADAIGDGAAKSAADTTGQYRTAAILGTRQPRENKGETKSKVPPVGVELGRKTNGVLRHGRKALRKALRRIKVASPSRYRDTVDLLRQGVRRG
jgi:integrase